MPARWQWAEEKEEMEAAKFEYSFRKFGGEGKEGIGGCSLRRKLGSGFFFYEAKRKTNMFIGKGERTSRNRSLGCKHIVS